MILNLRQFEVTDPFGRAWQVEFRWHQNAISIRRSDTVDCKYYLTSAEERREVVVALPHAGLSELARERGRALTDPWCMGLAALHLRHMISTWADMDAPIATVGAPALARYATSLEASARDERERVANTH